MQAKMLIGVFVIDVLFQEQYLRNFAATGRSSTLRKRIGRGALANSSSFSPSPEILRLLHSHPPVAGTFLWNSRPLAAVKDAQYCCFPETGDFEGWGCRADQRNYPRRHNINRVGVGSGVYSLGAPRQIEFGLRISFWRRTKRAEISQ
jgi:hypothetical protein